MTRLVPALLCVLAIAGCNRDSYVSLMDGEWSGSALNPVIAAPEVVSATFIYNDEVDVLNFNGQFDMGGWVYDVYAASSDKESATVQMFHNVGARKLDLATVVVDKKEGTMNGSYTLNICYENLAPIPGADPATCISSGTFSLTRLGPPGGATPTAAAGTAAAAQ